MIDPITLGDTIMRQPALRVWRQVGADNRIAEWFNQAEGTQQVATVPDAQSIRRILIDHLDDLSADDLARINFILSGNLADPTMRSALRTRLPTPARAAYDTLITRPATRFEALLGVTGAVTTADISRALARFRQGFTSRLEQVSR